MAAWRSHISVIILDTKNDYRIMPALSILCSMLSEKTLCADMLPL